MGADVVGGRPRLAALTMVRDEAAMLPRWVEHYTRQCGGPDALLVIDDNSADGSTRDLPCPVVRLPGELTHHRFERARMGLLNSFAAGLLEAYDAVVFTDADELLVADPDRHRDLRDFLAHRPPTAAFGAMGLNVLHDLETEGDLDPSRPVLDQRHLAKFVPLMCKPSLKCVPARWTAASHGIHVPFEIDPDLYLFHLKFADRSTLAAMAEERRGVSTGLGRALGSTWVRGPEAMLRVLERSSRGVRRERLRSFEPPAQRRRQEIVQDRGEVHRVAGVNQARAMLVKPTVVIPERFRGVL